MKSTIHIAEITVKSDRIMTPHSATVKDLDFVLELTLDELVAIFERYPAIITAVLKEVTR